MATTTIIEAGSPIQYWRKIKECWQYRDLLRMLSYRDVRVRYAQTFLGMAWAIINPLISVLLLYFVFGVVIKVDTQGVPPLLFSMAGLCSWNYFSRVVGEAGSSVIGAQSLVKKIYFPRLIIPLSKSFSALIDLVIVLMILAGMMLIYHIPVTWNALMIIPFTALTILAGIAFGVWVAALTIRFRDFTHILPLVLRIGMFLSPIAYGATLVPQPYKWAFNLNPLTGVIEGFRWALFNTPMDINAVWTSIAVIMIILVGGIWYFLRMDQYIADII
ncbi:MAG: ABC transporter permease [Saprospiraceae bacterium]|nr:ABC transporter permease [Candidatus Opimibacter iunctus]